MEKISGRLPLPYCPSPQSQGSDVKSFCLAYAVEGRFMFELVQMFFKYWYMLSRPDEFSLRGLFTNVFLVI